MLKFTSLSPVIDNPSFHLDYHTTFGTQDITDVSNLCDQITASLNAVPSGAVSAPGHYLAPVVSRTAGQSMIDVYDVTNHLDGSRAGSPVQIKSWSLTSSPFGGAVPEGCAVALTLQASFGTDVEFGPGTRPRARDRGRVYFGPIDGAAIGVEGTTNRTVVAPQCQIDLTAWIKKINVIITTSNTITYKLAVWSRKNAAMKDLVSVAVDDRPDYQRRRADQGATKLSVGLP